MKADPIAEKFENARSLLLGMSPPFVVAGNSVKGIELIGNVPAPYGSNQKLIPGMYFASVVVRKDALSLYFFPLYSEPSLIDGIPDSLRSRLTGKTCFTFKKNHELDLKSLQKLLKKGASLWKKKGYLK